MCLLGTVKGVGHRRFEPIWNLYMTYEFNLYDEELNEYTMRAHLLWVVNNEIYELYDVYNKCVMMKWDLFGHTQHLPFLEDG